MEEIIIDGINVAGCEYVLNNKLKGKQHSPAKSMPYAKESSCVCRKSIDTPYNFCKHNPNCHYKQLKRLEQENAELKEEIKKINSMYLKADVSKSQYSFYLDKEEKENHELRKALEEIMGISIHEIKELTDSAINGGRYLDILDKINEVLRNE